MKKTWLELINEDIRPTVDGLRYALTTCGDLKVAVTNIEGSKTILLIYMQDKGYLTEELEHIWFDEPSMVIKMMLLSNPLSDSVQERGLTSEDLRVRETFTDSLIGMSHFQMRRAMKDKSWRVRRAVFSREDFMPTWDEYQKILKDPSKRVRDSVGEHSKKWTQIIEAGKLKKLIVSVSPREAKKVL